MKKHLIVSGIVIILLVVGLCGCNEISNPSTGIDDSRFLGTWKSEINTITFFSDGTGSQSSVSFQWEIKDGKLVWDVHQIEISMIFDYQFSDNDTTLTLKEINNEIPVVYTKQ